jgi:hypothetical protein
MWCKRITAFVFLAICIAKFNAFAEVSEKSVGTTILGFIKIVSFNLYSKKKKKM